MVRRRIFLAVILLVCIRSSSQNLVPNPSFESLTSCPSFASQIDKAAPWFNPNAGTPELFNECASWGSFVSLPATATGGFQYARTGDGFAGLYVFRSDVTDMREYIEVPLTSGLLPDHCYYFEMYVNLPNDFELACDGIGARFSNGVLEPPTDGFVMGMPAHIENDAGVLLADSLGWMKISGYYNAQGGEDHLVIGNFKDNSNTTWSVFQLNVWYENSAYLYVDDVSVISMEDALDLGNDTTICDGTPLLLDATFPDADVLWSDGSTNSTLISSLSGTYWVEVTTDACTFRDSIDVQFRSTPNFDLGPDIVLCNEQDVYLQINTSNEDSILWSDGSSGSDLTVRSLDPVWATVSNVCGVHSDTIRIEIGECIEEVYVPNAFSPNGDGINDLFFPIYDHNVHELTMDVFDRWGKLVFSISSEPWDGTLNGTALPAGVYIWAIRNSISGEAGRSGHVTLIR